MCRQRRAPPACAGRRLQRICCLARRRSRIPPVAMHKVQGVLGMEYIVTHDQLGTHLDWRHDAVTARMIDWFWSNMEKAFILWHPEQHEPLEWPVPPRHGDPLGAIHNAPQTWDDGRRQNLFIRFEHLQNVPPEVRDVIVYNHVMIVAGLGLDEEAMRRGEPMGYRVHQWQ